MSEKIAFIVVMSSIVVYLIIILAFVLSIKI